MNTLLFSSLELDALDLADHFDNSLYAYALLQENRSV